MTNTDRDTEFQQLRDEVKQLRYERDMLRALLDHEPFYSYVRDLDYRYVFSNKAHREKMGVPLLEHVIGKKVGDFFQDEYAHIYEDDDRRVIEDDEPVISREAKSELENGDMMWHQTSKYPVHDNNGNVIGLVGITIDVTAEKQKQAIIANQQAILREVGTPIIPIVEGIVILPLIGDIDSQRAVDMTRKVMKGINEYDASVIIIDITGVPLVDTGVVAHFNRTIQAIRLKGAKAIITGITESVAEAIVDLGIDWSDIATVADLQSGLKVAMEWHNTQN